LKPVYAEAADGDCVAAWLERSGGRVPLRRIDDYPVEITALAAAPLTGEAAAVARNLAERLEDVRVAAAVLTGAAAHATIAIDGRLMPSLSHLAWTGSARAAIEPLRRIVDACGDFEDALAKAGETSAPHGDWSPDVSAPPVRSAVAALETVGAAFPREETLATIAAVSKTIAAVRPYAQAVARGARAIAASSILPVGALTVDELAELERVGRVSSAAIECDARLIADFTPPFSRDL
jgi:hypothetical protein